MGCAFCFLLVFFLMFLFLRVFPKLRGSLINELNRLMFCKMICV